MQLVGVTKMNRKVFSVCLQGITFPCHCVTPHTLLSESINIPTKHSIWKTLSINYHLHIASNSYLQSSAAEDMSGNGGKWSFVSLHPLGAACPDSARNHLAHNEQKHEQPDFPPPMATWYKLNYNSSFVLYKTTDKKRDHYFQVLISWRKICQSYYSLIRNRNKTKIPTHKLQTHTHTPY